MPAGLVSCGSYNGTEPESAVHNGGRQALADDLVEGEVPMKSIRRNVSRVGINNGRGVECRYATVTLSLKHL